MWGWQPTRGHNSVAINAAAGDTVEVAGARIVIPAGALSQNTVGKPYELYELLYNATDGSGALGTFDGAGAFRKLRTYAAADLHAGQNTLRTCPKGCLLWWCRASGYADGAFKEWLLEAGRLIVDT